MIDWITAIVPCTQSSHVTGGQVISTSKDGELDWITSKYLTIEGSYSSKVQIKTSDDNHLYITGNLVKYIQGHNIFGTDDLVNLVAEFMHSITSSLPDYLCPTPEEKNQWSNGEFLLKRVDVNYSWTLRNTPEVLSWIRGASARAHLRHRGAGQMKGDTLYFGKHSKRWGFKFYSKGQEIKAKGHTLPLMLSETSLTAYAAPLLRGELVLRSMELKRLNLDNGYNWEEHTPKEIHLDKISGLEMTDSLKLTNHEIENLPPRLRSSYTLWKDGHDLRMLLSKPTFYRHRSELLNHGIDISIQQDRDTSMNNVVPLIRTLEAVPAEIPDWAIGTPLYFEPRKRFIA